MRGPRWHQETILLTASAGPSKTASTLPSGRFRTHPARSFCCAMRRALARKNTPCTRPLMTTLALASSSVLTLPLP